jgi:hypothetical protein
MIARGSLIVCTAVLLLISTGLGFGESLREARRVEAHSGYETTHTFRGGERACVIVVGDHKPPSPMEVRVFDAKKRLVAETRADTDTAAVIWYPPVTGNYRIEVRNHGDEYNAMMIYYQGTVKR